MENLAILNKKYYAAKQKLERDPENDFNYREIRNVLFAFMDFSRETKNDNWFLRSLSELMRNRPLTNDAYFYETLAFKLGKYIWYLKPDDNTPIDDSKVAPVLKILHGLPFSRGGMGFKFLLKAFLRLEPDSSLVPEFLNWLLESPLILKNEDCQDQKAADKEINYPAFTKTLVSSLKKMLLLMDYSSDENSLAAQLDEFLTTILQEAVKENSRYQYWFFYRYFLMQIKNWRGEDIFDEMKGLVAQKSKEFYLWDLLAQHAPEKDKLACYAAALYNGINEEMLIKVHVKMAYQLITQELYDYASAEINIAVQTRNKNDWPIPLDLQELMNNKWYKPQNNIGSNKRKAFYREKAFDAFKLIGEAKTGIFIGFNKLKNDKGVLYYYNFAVLSRQSHTLLSKRPLDLTTGAAYELLIDKAHSSRDKVKIMFFRPTDKYPVDLLKTEKGELRMPEGKTHGFLNDVFLPPPFIEKYRLQHNQLLSVQAVKNWNKTRNEWGWLAIKLNKQ